MTNEEAREILKRVEIAKPIKFEDYADMREALDLAIKVLEQTRWISVSEEPQEGEYLITGAYGKNRYVDIATYECGEWFSYSDEFKLDKGKHRVIAYMSPPQPYKGKSEDEE